MKKSKNNSYFHFYECLNVSLIKLPNLSSQINLSESCTTLLKFTNKNFTGEYKR